MANLKEMCMSPEACLRDKKERSSPRPIKQDFHTTEEGQWLKGLPHVWELVPDHLRPRPVLFDPMGFHSGKETPQVQAVTCL